MDFVLRRVNWWPLLTFYLWFSEHQGCFCMFLLHRPFHHAGWCDKLCRVLRAIYVDLCSPGPHRYSWRCCGCAGGWWEIFFRGSWFETKPMDDNHRSHSPTRLPQHVARFAFALNHFLATSSTTFIVVVRHPILRDKDWEGWFGLLWGQLMWFDNGAGPSLAFLFLEGHTKMFRSEASHETAWMEYWEKPLGRSFRLFRRWPRWVWGPSSTSLSRRWPCGAPNKGGEQQRCRTHDSCPTLFLGVFQHLMVAYFIKHHQTTFSGLLHWILVLDVANTPHNSLQKFHFRVRMPVSCNEVSQVSLVHEPLPPPHFVLSWTAFRRARALWALCHGGWGGPRSSQRDSGGELFISFHFWET